MVNLVNHPFPARRVTLIARVIRPRVLRYKGAEYTPKVTPDGMPVYDVPADYAEQLLSGEPNKWALLSPESIELRLQLPGQMGKSAVLVTAVVPVNGADGEVLRGRNGLPVYADPEDAEMLGQRVKKEDTVLKKRGTKPVGKKSSTGVTDAVDQKSSDSML